MTKLSAKKYGFDTNLIIYALDKSSMFYEDTEQLLTQLISQEASLFVTHQNVLEAERILQKLYKVPFSKSYPAIGNFLQAYDFIYLSPLPTTLQTYHQISEENKNKKLDIFDAYLAATLIDNNIHHLLTLNTKDFKGIKKLEAVKPF